MPAHRYEYYTDLLEGKKLLDRRIKACEEARLRCAPRSWGRRFWKKTITELKKTYK
jgi:hypothetical protein|tara:strand:+ start:1420 stop:1587 length:168 start_codon:yes stop_codon:yes gene_type:complete